MRTSYSALNVYNQCPLKYKFQEIDKIKTSKSRDMVFGTIIHGALKFFHQAGKFAAPALPEVIAYFESRWKEEIFGAEFEGQSLFAEGKAILEKYYKDNADKKASPIALELHFEAPVGDHIIAGNIDRIDKAEDSSFEIIDYKTSRRLPSQEAVDGDLQLAIYQMGFLKRWPQIDSPIKLSLYFLQHGIKLSSRRKPEDVEETKEKILLYIGQIEKAIKENDFKPLPGPLCDWCEHQKLCPMFCHKFKKNQTQEDIDIQKVMREYFKAKEIEQENAKTVAELKEKINQYCDKEKVERVFSDSGISIVRSAQQRFGCDWNVVSEVLKSAGKWEDVFEPSDAKLKKILPSLKTEDFRKIEETRKVESEFKVLRVEKK